MKLPADDLVHKGEFDQFADAVKTISPQYNFTYAPGKQVLVTHRTSLSHLKSISMEQKKSERMTL